MGFRSNGEKGAHLDSQHFWRFLLAATSRKTPQQAFLGKSACCGVEYNHRDVKAITDVAAGKCLFFGETFDSARIIRLFGGEENLETRKPQGLTPRELDVLQLTTSGYSNAQIASALEISLNTVDSYKERIKTKFGLDSIVECVAHAVADGLVSV